MMLRCCLAPSMVLVIVSFAGCWNRPDPALAPARGVVRIGGKPLSQALVRLTPATPGISSEWISEATTDDSGTFDLATSKGPGAVVGRHRVTVSEGAVPGEVRDDQARVAAWLRGLSERPIPERYGTLATSPLEATVGEEGATLELELVR